LAAAYTVSGEERYRRGAVAAWDWVLGANWLGRSFVTGIGTVSPQRPHHRYIAATGVMVPGLVVGGPNASAHRQDRVTPAAPGPLAYVDDERAYAVNEYAIDYNAPVVVLAAWLAEQEFARSS
jgi:endoglucanase